MKTIQFRSYTDQNFKAMEAQLKDIDWSFVVCADKPAEENILTFQNFLFSLFEDCFKLKTKVITNESEPWYTESLAVLKRKKCREYNKHRKSEKYLALEKSYKDAIYKAKHKYAAKNLNNLKSSNPRQLYYTGAIHIRLLQFL